MQRLCDKSVGVYAECVLGLIIFLIPNVVCFDMHENEPFFFLLCLSNFTILYNLKHYKTNARFFKRI